MFQDVSGCFIMFHMILLDVIQMHSNEFEPFWPYMLSNVIHISHFFQPYSRSFHTGCGRTEGRVETQRDMERPVVRVSCQ